jgi:hypothetical protein
MKPIEIAETQIGVQEIPKGSNKGEQVEDYLKVVGLPGGYAWCMAFVQWCFKHSELNFPFVSAGVLSVWAHTTAFHYTDPQPGDVFVMEFGHGTGHTGFVESIEGDNIHTIEGNTDTDGSREGFEVAKRIRNKHSILGYIRID